MANYSVQNISAQSSKTYEIAYPGKGGLNLQDLEYDQTSDQSPNMLNMMYKNGAFGKRYGQTYITDELDENILKLGYYKSKIIIHSGTKLYSYDASASTMNEIYDGLSKEKGVFINFNNSLYYLNGTFVVYDGKECKEVECYAPDLVINRTPDGSYSDLIENYNRLGTAFKNTFNGDGTSKVYVLTDTDLDKDSEVICEVDGKATTAFTVDYSSGKITFSTAPAKGQNNVVITANKTTQEYIDSILNCRLSANYGGNNNSRVFLAGGGNSTYYYSDVFDATYWPENNYQVLGNSETDITGFGEQNDSLMVFKQDSVYRIDYYLNDDNEARFTCVIVNPKIGCSASDSIQFINNRLTWFSNIYGVCTLVSTYIENEKNVQVISRNINGGYRASGLMQEENLEKCKSVNWNGQYWLTVNEHVYMWDYTISPYSDSGKPDYDASRLSWFLFDNFDVTDFVVDGKELYYARGKRIVGLNDNFDDFGEAIQARYQSPLLDFNLPDYLKTVKRVFFQVRANTPSKIKIRYITEEEPEGEEETEDIEIYTCIWNGFVWDAFGWDIVNFAKEFPRRCNLKKINLAAVLMTNDEVYRDMSVSNIKLNYIPVKEVK